MSRKLVQVKPSIRITHIGLGGYSCSIIGCRDVLILGKTPIKWRQRPDMTIAVDWDAKPQLKQTQINTTPINIAFPITIQHQNLSGP